MNEIVLNKDGTLRSLIGRDAVSLARVSTIMSGLNIHIHTGGQMRLTRMATPTFLMKTASEYTGIKYKRGQYQKAHDDLKVWFELMKSALPITHQV